MIITYIYLIGCVVALILGLIILIKESKDSKKELQPGLICPLILMSWFSVYIIFWKLRDKVFS